MRGILYSRRLYEKINPAAFRHNITVMLEDVTVNSLGENIVSYTEGATVRALVAYRDATREDLNSNNTAQVYSEVYTVLTWSNTVGLLNAQNRIKIHWHDGTSQICRIDATYEEYGKFTRLRLMYDK